MGKVISVTCDMDYDPPRIIICFDNLVCYPMPKILYDWIREQLGWPDVVCEGTV